MEDEATGKDPLFRRLVRVALTVSVIGVAGVGVVGAESSSPSGGDAIFIVTCARCGGSLGGVGRGGFKGRG